jgi:Flp pilus assembly protein TadB
LNHPKIQRRNNNGRNNNSNLLLLKPWSFVVVFVVVAALLRPWSGYCVPIIFVVAALYFSCRRRRQATAAIRTPSSRPSEQANLAEHARTRPDFR